MPLSSNESARAAQLANLDPRARVPKPGEQRALRHGAWSDALVRDVEAEVVEIMDALGDAAPVQVHDPMFTAAVERCARTLKRVRHLEQWIDLHGMIDERRGKNGQLKPAARYLYSELGPSLDSQLDRLGMTPAGAARLGWLVARVRSLAEQMSDDDDQADDAIVDEAEVDPC